jgi:hypothetical protein
MRESIGYASAENFRVAARTLSPPAVERTMMLASPRDGYEASLERNKIH